MKHNWRTRSGSFLQRCTRKNCYAERHSITGVIYETDRMREMRENSNEVQTSCFGSSRFKKTS